MSLTTSIIQIFSKSWRDVTYKTKITRLFFSLLISGEKDCLEMNEIVYDYKIFSITEAKLDYRSCGQLCKHKTMFALYILGKCNKKYPYEFSSYFKSFIVLIPFAWLLQYFLHEIAGKNICEDKVLGTHICNRPWYINPQVFHWKT